MPRWLGWGSQQACFRAESTDKDAGQEYFCGSHEEAEQIYSLGALVGKEDWNSAGWGNQEKYVDLHITKHHSMRQNRLELL